MADKDAVTIQDIDYVTPGAKTSKTPEKKKSSSPPRGARVVPTKPAKKYESDSFVKMELKSINLQQYENPLAQAGYQKMDQLKILTTKDLGKLVLNLGMSPPEITRLYKALGRKPGLDILMGALSKKPVNRPPSKADPTKTKAQTSPPKQKSAPVRKPAPKPKPIPKSKPAPAPAPKKVDPATLPKARVQSKWNPGNTVESRNYSEAAHARIRDELLQFELAPGIKVTKVVDVDGDLTVVVSRGKVKCIYDFSFHVEWAGVLEKKVVKGILKMSDIMPDDDEWVAQGDTKSRLAQSLIMSEHNKLIPRLNETIFIPMMLHFKTKQFSGYTMTNKDLTYAKMEEVS